MGGNGGIIVRLIDIVLILLFGFISISEIDKKSKVRLSETQKIPIVKLDKEQIVVIGVVSPNEFAIESEAKQNLVYHDLPSLFQYLEYKKAEYAKHDSLEMKVRIRSNWFLPVKHAMDIALFCEILKVERSLDVRIAGGD